ncbi:NAD(P)/FAD-dependent oxidoreductase [Bythopirellula polymerisocia]|uniref:Putative FAD-dependent oxidoreductase LodB n=1 Tax=Bythopirellula polymerisocia TaxID=2528003 RepID=A0A5C6CJP3_9BACT|nr:NAD(P)/FAD-dependent oxidoreductase [Bythopirellula polymerisocia]TWU23807.1 putative FAD-dependent oxidoreductase LodB [Bythopirellula polymerisocia]
MREIESSYDCVVLGAGPAGSTVATLVAAAGHRTLLVERAAMPRPHVGESLMPETYWIFERLGILPQLQRDVYARKVGVQFVNSTGRESAPFYFRSHDDRDCSETWHVNRADFDQLMFENAAQHGAECRDQTRALDVIMEGDRAVGVRLQNPEGEIRQVEARVVVDATGQQSLLAAKLGLKQMNPNLRKTSIWGHFRGGKVDTEGGGVKTVILQTTENRSWFWYIPQADNLVSVGLVGDNDYLLRGRGTPREVFDEELANCATLGEWLASAEPADELRVVKEFSYSTDRSAGDGWVLVGDAWGFIDPIYSSGVYFALKSGELAADAILDGLRTNDLSATMLGRWVADFSRQTNLIRKLVHAFYSGEFRVGQFVQEYPEHQAELVDLLIGRVFDGRPGKIFDDLDPWLERKLTQAATRA